MSNHKVAAITGCNTGIGKFTAIELARQGYELIMLVRDSQKSRKALEEIKQSSGSNQVQLFYVDLASLDAIQKLANELQQQCSKIDLLINNAGILKRKEERSPDGFELTIAVNYIAPFYLTQLLLPLVKKAESARIINLSSALYKRGEVHLENQFSGAQFDGIQAYADSKLLLNYFTKSLAERLSEHHITVNALHPGMIGTDVFRAYPKWIHKLLNLFIPSPEQGAKAPLYLATAEEVKDVTGAYFNKTQKKEMTAQAYEAALAEEIWQKTEELIRMHI